jgi:hypothetical protein
MLAVALLALLQEDLAALAARVDTQIPWITDGTELVDMELAAGHHPQFPEAREAKNLRVDRRPILEKALARARAEKKLVLWYVPRVVGLHMYRAILPDRYMRIAVFTDPRVAAFVEARFVPLRMCADGLAGIKPFEFVEPGFVFLAPDGKVVHVLDRLRTYDAGWFRAAFQAVLRANPGFGSSDEPPGPPPGEAEAAYVRAVEGWWAGKDPSAALRELCRRHPDSPWAWRAAANLVKAEDGLPRGPLLHHFEGAGVPRPDVAPRSTRRPAPDAAAAAKGAVDFLLRAQREDGSWQDVRYAYWPDARILPNIHGAITALAALALLEWGDPRAEAAIAKADAWLRDEANFARDRHEECYAHAYRLHYFARRGDTTSMGKVVARLAAIQEDEGFWAHEYANAFATAAVAHALVTARTAGAEVPGFILQRAADALLSARDPQGRQPYRVGEKPDNDKSTSARTALCELALRGIGRPADVAAGVDRYWAFQKRMEGVRLYDYHSDGRLAGFFYFHAGFHTLEAARTLPEPARGTSLKRFREQLLEIPEIDGAFVDSHELGKSYGTASALLMLARSRD